MSQTDPLEMWCYAPQHYILEILRHVPERSTTARLRSALQDALRRCAERCATPQLERSHQETCESGSYIIPAEAVKIAFPDLDVVDQATTGDVSDNCRLFWWSRIAAMRDYAASPQAVVDYADRANGIRVIAYG